MEGPPELRVDEALCGRCSAIDFSIFESGRVIDVDFREGVFLQKLGFLSSASEASCPLCHFFSTSFPHLQHPANALANLSGRIDDDYQLRAYSSLLSYHGVTNKELRRKLHRQDRILLGVVRNGDFNPKLLSFFSSIPRQGKERKHEEETSFGGRLLSPEVDLTQVIGWMDFCDQNHKNCSHYDNELQMRKRRQGEEAGLSKDSDGMSMDGDLEHLSAWPSRLRVIDCRTGQVVSILKGSKYIALSYVWGEPRENEQRMDPYLEFEDVVVIKLPAMLPRTIRDAIESVKRMEMRYLWVDQYCIPQLDGPAKAEQIAQMHLIYKCAYATIVASSGSDAYSGLPGVSLPRRPQPQVSLNSRTLVSTMINPQEEVMSSVWCTRGWTYQEGVFSGRCLFWTNDQIYFECNVMNAGEAVSKPPLPLHNLKRTTFRSGIRQSIFKSPNFSADETLNLQRFHFKRNWHKWKNGNWVLGKHRELETYQVPSKDLQSFHHYLEKYTERQLRYSSDSLNAFAGLLGAFADMKYSISPYWGIPIGKEHTSSLQRNLSWYHIDGTKPVRRPEFPSWSWAGWSGAVKFESWKPFIPSDKSFHLDSKWPKFRVNISPHGHRLRRLRSPQDALKLTQLQIRKPTLHVAANLISIKLKYISEAEDLNLLGSSVEIAGCKKSGSEMAAADFKPGFYSCLKVGEHTLCAKAFISVRTSRGSRQRALLLQKPCIGLYLGYNGDGKICVMLIQRKTKTTFERIGYITSDSFLSRSYWGGRIKGRVPGMRMSSTGRHLFQLV